jgi:hypothetical protein
MPHTSASRKPADEAEEALENGQHWEGQTFGVVYAILKDRKFRSYKFAVSYFVLEFLQLLMVVMQPKFGWTVNMDLWYVTKPPTK